MKNFIHQQQTKALHLPLWLAASLIAFASCADEMGLDNGFDVGVKNQQLFTPPSDSIRFQVSTDGTKATVSWPLVMGALGYEVTFKNVDDPENPRVIDGFENKLVDGTSMTVSVTEDSKYEMTLRVLGDPDRGNKGDTAIVTSLSTLVPSVLTIPSGSDITEFIQQFRDSTGFTNFVDTSALATGYEIAIDLEARGEYTMSGPVNFHGQQMTFRGDKLYPPTVKMTGSGAFHTYSMLKIKYINFDMAESTANGFITISNENLPDSLLGKNQPHKYSGPKFQGNNYMLEEPLYIANCMFKDMPRGILYDNQVKCAIWYFTISDCIIQCKNTERKTFINLEKAGAAIKHLVIKNSTLYNTVDCSAYFLRYSNNSNAQAVKSFGERDASYSTITTDFTNVTFSRMFTGEKWWNNTSGGGQHTTIQQCIFHNMTPSNVARRITGHRTYRFNFWQGADSDDCARTDNNNAPFAKSYPDIFLGEFSQSLDFSQPNGGVDFTPQNYEVIKYVAGDKRWLPIRDSSSGTDSETEEPSEETGEAVE